MSIRIQNDGIAGAGASQINPADLQTSGTSGRGSSSIGGFADRVEISSLSENLSSATASLDAQHADKVSRIAALYAQGQYQVDSATLSNSLVSNALNATGMETGD
jgi:hypothetical protein